MNTLISILEKAAKATPQKGIVHINYGETDVFQSYAELYEQSKHLAFLLRKKGLRDGDVVILSVDKSYHFTVLFWGCILAGIIPAPMPTIRGQHTSSVAFRRLMVAMKYLRAPLITSAGNNLPADFPEHFVAETLIRQCQLENYDVVIHQPQPEEIAVIQFSSGSTGDPKGVMLSHSNILANLKLKSLLDHVTPDDTLIHWMPYFHDFGLFGNHLNCVYNGIMEVRLDPMTYLRNPLLWLEKIDEYHATIGGSTPTGLKILLRHLEIETSSQTIDLSHLKILSIGAEMIPASLFEETCKSLSVYGFLSSAYCPAYGMAETTLVVAGTNIKEGFRSFSADRSALSLGHAIEISRSSEQATEIVSVGKPLGDIQIRIANDNQEIETYQVGEIQVKGMCVMQGYYNNEEATQKTFIDGWLQTGDYGFFDKTGYLYIIGRKKEIIIVNGQNFFPFDLEMCIHSEHNSEIELSVLTSFYDNTLGREVILHFFVPKNRHIDFRTTSIHCNTTLAKLSGISIDYSIPIRKGDIPKTSSSKTMRGELAKKFKENYFDNIIISNIQSTMNNQNIQKSIDHYETLSSIWCNALSLAIESTSLSLSDNFFSLGGDSIRSMKAVAQIETHYGRKVEANFIYKHPTLGEQIDYLKQVDNKALTPPTDEYELLIREIISETLHTEANNIDTTENFLSKTKNLHQAIQLIDHLKQIFHIEDQNDQLQNATNICQIANIVRNELGNNPNTSFPLMDFQETLFYHSKSFLRNEPTGLSCYIICRTTLIGNFKKEYFDKAFNYVIRMHPILHSVISEEEEIPSMITLEEYPTFESNYTDLSTLSNQEQERFFEQNDLADHDHRFNLSLYPLFYANIFKTGENTHEIVIHIDHQLIDGFSFFEFISTILSLYDKFASGKTLPEPSPNGLQFADYVRLEKMRSTTVRYQEAMKFALDVFKNVPEKIAIPMRQNPSKLESVHFNTLHTQIHPAVMYSVMEIAQSMPNISINSLLLACYFKLMNLWSGQNDLIINMPVYNREQHFPHAREVVGSFLDIFPVRVQTTPAEPIISIAQKIERFVRTLMEYPISSIELTRRIALQENLKQGSLSSIIFSNSIHMIPEGTSQYSKHFKMCAPKVQTGAPGTYIDLVMFTWEGEWHFDWNYVRELFDETFITMLSAQYTSMLEQLAQQTPKTLELATFAGTDIMPKKYKQLLHEINQTSHDYPYTTINEWISKTVKAHPKRIAVSYEEQELTYADFYQRATQLAHLLIEVGLQPGERVALLMHRKLELPISQLAILIAGGVYVPIDPRYPQERIQYMLKDCGAKILISQQNLVDIIEQTYTPSLKYCVFTDTKSKPTLSVNYSCLCMGDIAQQPLTEITPRNTPEDLIYMIYTSGSTGQPKGTMLRHRNVCNFLYYVQKTFQTTADDRFAFVTSYSFDMTVTSNWLPFLIGSSLHILSEEKTQDVEQLLHFISEKEISFLNITPSHFSMLANTLEFTDEHINLRKEMTIMLGAEVIHANDVNKWLSFYPLHRLINEYGPTETTVASTFFPIPTPNGKCTLEIIPIGKPIYNTQVYILNEDNQCCMPGVVGMLYIGGAGVALGYLNKEEKTKNVFIPNPLTNNPNDIVYNTGDLAKFTESGDIVYIGRKDFQVNVRGYRIELGEIEHALSKLPCIGECCADIQYDSNQQAVVVAFYTTKSSYAPNEETLLKELGKMLPQYMVPSSILKIDKIPITPNGKIDKKSLPNIAIKKQQMRSVSFVAPRNEYEKQMAHIWCSILGIPEVGIYDNFWEIGGDSIKSVRLIKELKNAGFKSIKLREIFNSPTIAQMINQLKSTDESDNLLILKRPKSPSACLFCLPYAAGTAGMYAPVSEDFSSSMTILSTNYPGHGDARPLMKRIESLSELYIEELKQQTLPIYLLGYSYGGYVAYDICRKLEQSKVYPKGIILVGTTPPNIKDELMRFYLTHQASYERQENEIFNPTFLATLSDEERTDYLNQLQSDTEAMLNYSFSTSPLQTPLLAIVGKDEEPAIKQHQSIWKTYFNDVSYTTLSGGHLLIKEHHKELAQAIESFINHIK